MTGELLSAPVTTGQRLLGGHTAQTTSGMVPGFPRTFEAHASERTYSIQVPASTVGVGDTDARRPQAWLDASAAELGSFLHDLESELSERELRAWLAAFEE